LWTVARLGTPLRADLAYLLLKPVEWFARVCLLVAIPGQANAVHCLYRPAETR
jgi:hypothetical protein